MNHLNPSNADSILPLPQVLARLDRQIALLEAARDYVLLNQPPASAPHRASTELPTGHRSPRRQRRA